MLTKNCLGALFFLGVLCLVSLNGFARQTLYWGNTEVINYDELDGLPVRDITAFEQDSHGLFWVGTKAGLFIFDRKKFYPASYLLKGSDLVLKYEIIDIKFSPVYNILLVSSYNPDKDSTYIQQFPLDDHVRLQQVGNTDLVALRSKAPKFTASLDRSRYTFSKLGIFFSISIAKDHSGLITLGLDHSKWNEYLKKITEILLFINPNMKPGVKIISEVYFYVTQFITGKLSLPLDISFLDFPASKSKLAVSLQPEDDIENYKEILSRLNLMDEYSNLIGVLRVRQDIAYLYGRLGILRISNHNPVVSASISTNEARSIDFNSGIKSGCFASSNGIKIFSLNEQKTISITRTLFPHSYYITSVKVSDSALLFLPLGGFQENAVLLKRDYKTVEIIESKYEGLIFSCSVSDSDNNFLIGTSKGLYRGSLLSQRLLLTKINEFPSVYVNALCKLDSNRIIAGTSSGVFIFQQKKNNVSRILNDETLSLEVAGPYVACGTRYGGCALLNNDLSLRKYISIESGLPSNMIYNLKYIEEQNSLWMGTAKGLVAYHMLVEQIRVFTTRDGLPSDECNRNSTFYSKGDSVFFVGGIKGISAISFRKLYDSKTDYVKNDMPFVWYYEALHDSGKKESRMGWRMDRIPSFDYDLQELRLMIITAFIRSNTATIGYSIDNSSWNYIGNESSLVLNHLTPGRHEIRLICRYYDGSSSESRAYLFVIKKPWYFQWRFVFVIGFLLTGIIYKLHSWRMRLLKLGFMEESEKSREQLLRILAHDLRSPVKSLQGFSNSIAFLLKKNDHNRLLQTATEVQSAIMGLELTIDSLFEWNILKKAKDRGQKSPVDVCQLIQLNIDLFSFFAASKSVRVEFSPDCPVTIFTDRDLVSLLFRNLIDNSLKYSPEGETVFITAFLDNETRNLHFVVRNKFDESQKESVISLHKSGLEPEGNTSKTLGLLFIEQAISELEGNNILKVDIVNQTVEWQIILPELN